MIALEDLRRALAQHLNTTLTPEAAADVVLRALDGEDLAINPGQFAPEQRDGYTFQAESFRAVRDELEPLHAQHFAETERYRAHQGLNPDLDAIARDERRGRLLQFTLRAADGTLVGNARFYTGKSRHTGATFAQEDTFYVLPAHRRGLLAVRFWQYAERCLAALDVVEVRTDSKLSNNVNRLNEYLGYQAIAVKYVKPLKGTDHVR